MNRERAFSGIDYLLYAVRREVEHAAVNGEVADLHFILRQALTTVRAHTRPRRTPARRRSRHQRPRPATRPARPREDHMTHTRARNPEVTVAVPDPRAPGGATSPGQSKGPRSPQPRPHRADQLHSASPEGTAITSMTDPDDRGPQNVPPFSPMLDEDQLDAAAVAALQGLQPWLADGNGGGDEDRAYLRVLLTVGRDGDGSLRAAYSRVALEFVSPTEVTP